MKGKGTLNYTVTKTREQQSPKVSRLPPNLQPNIRNNITKTPIRQIRDEGVF